MAEDTRVPTRVVVADDHAIVRAGVRSVLERIAGVSIVGEASDGATMVTLIEEQRPDIAILDIAMGATSGIDVTRQVVLRFPEVRVIVMSMHIHEGYVMQALDAGAVAYLPKDAATVELPLALDAVRRREIYLSPTIAGAVVNRVLRRPGDDTRAAGAHLTPRHREILTYIANGRSTKQIAAALDVSVKTVESHRAEMMRRLAIHDVAGLVRYALEAGLIPPVH